MTATQPETFHVSTTTAEGVSYIHVSGEIDLSTADVLRAAGTAAISNYVGTIRVDLSEVTFMDSTGLAALIEISNRAGDRHTLILEHPAPQVARLLEITGLGQHFTIAD